MTTRIKQYDIGVTTMYTHRINYIITQIKHKHGWWQQLTVITQIRPDDTGIAPKMITHENQWYGDNNHGWCHFIAQRKQYNIRVITTNDDDIW